MIFYFLRRPRISAFLALSLLAIMIFGLSLTFGFVLDDESQVVNNENIHSMGKILYSFTGSTMESRGAKKMAGIYYKPIMTISYTLLWAISHEAWIFHAFQLLLHILNSFLIFMLFGEMGKFTQVSWSAGLCFILAAGFLTHPINVESVVYIADLQDVLYSFFGLLALNFVARYRGTDFRLVLGLGLLFELSLLSKESGILYLLTVGMFFYFFSRKKLKLWVWAVLGAGVIYLGLRVGVANLTSGSNSSQMLRADLLDRLISMPKILFHYFVVFLFPKELTLVQDWVVKDFGFSEFWFPLLGLLGILKCFFLLLRKMREPVLLFFLMWFILGMGAHSNLVPLDGTVADRWFYFPLVGLLGVLGVYCSRNFEKLGAGNRRISIFVVLALLLGWSGRSFARTLDWRSGFLLYQHDLALMPDNFYLNNNVGVELFRVGDTRGALKYFEKSAELFPEWATSWSNLGAAHFKLENWAEAERCYQRSVENGPSNIAYQNYAALLQKLGKNEVLRLFLEQRALIAFPDNPFYKELHEELLRTGM